MAVSLYLVLMLSLVILLWLYGERWRPIRASTLKFLKEAGMRRILNLSVLHSYLYGRWTNQYVDLLVNRLMPRLGSKGKEWLANRYHGKVLTHGQARAIIVAEKDIQLRDLERVVPYSQARDFLIKTPLEIAVYECGCRNARENPCRPTQVCMVIGQPFVDFVLEHNPKSSRLVTKEEALEILRAEHERGHIHSAWFKDACLDRFYSICNCCKCCCGGVRAMKLHGIAMLASSGFVASIDEEKCVRCGLCVEFCPFEALMLEERVVLNWEMCMGCGVCVGQCENGAISLVRDERKGEPLDVSVL